MKIAKKAKFAEMNNVRSAYHVKIIKIVMAIFVVPKNAVFQLKDVLMIQINVIHYLE